MVDLSIVLLVITRGYPPKKCAQPTELFETDMVKMARSWECTVLEIRLFPAKKVRTRGEWYSSGLKLIMPRRFSK